MAGPLAGIKVVELAGLGALPFGSLKLADMGAEVVRVDRLSDVPEDRTPRPHNFWDRGRRSVAVDLKDPRGVETVLRLADGADAFLEAFRPGVAERLGLGPDVLLKRKPALVYGRLTGWGQDGPLAQVAGHSLNYEAITGAVGLIGPRGGPPPPPLTLLGDFAGGGLHLAYGVVCALLEAQRSGRGQVVDAAMVDGVTSLLGVFHGMDAMGMMSEETGTNLFDGGAHFYNVYETRDGRYVSVASVEPHFYALLLEKIGLDPKDLPGQYDEAHWPEMRERFAEVFVSRTRDEWSAILEGSDACYAPVLTLAEARDYPHNRARNVFLEGRATPELAPTPRLSLTPGEPGPSPAWPGADTDAVLAAAGFSADEISALREAGTIP
ncbi:MAG: CaiB/BaiF CoA-transferase family protein [Myxococcota bacterium]|jgi:alpha-methylacyl-CoA racemase|nr:CaiB/BaiF CoA-transferase family protein [Myxococcota bacterium]